jgi:hypothetical protein
MYGQDIAACVLAQIVSCVGSFFKTRRQRKRGKQSDQTDGEIALASLLIMDETKPCAGLFMLGSLRKFGRFIKLPCEPLKASSYLKYVV